MGDIDYKLSPSEAFLGRLYAVAKQSALAEMASGMAHALSQPLAAITTFSHAGERMLDRPSPMIASALEVFRQVSDEALNAGNHLQTIRRLFEYPCCNFSPVNMVDLITELLPLLSGLARESDVRLELDQLGDIPDVQVAQLQIQQVLVALTQNALEASSALAGERIIRIDSSVHRHTVETGISDLGCGIAQELSVEIFHPFFSTKSGGNGLGLASSRAIIEAHDGTIGFDNLPDRGCRFWFRLPITRG